MARKPVKPTVFISHTKRNHGFVQKLAADLERDGCNVWLDDVDLHIGDGLPEGIHSAIKASHFLVAVLSKSSVKQPWVLVELAHAYTKTVVEGKRFILPIVVTECELPAFLEGRKYGDFKKWRQPAEYQTAYERLLAAIRA